MIAEEPFWYSKEGRLGLKSLEEPIKTIFAVEQKILWNVLIPRESKAGIFFRHLWFLTSSVSKSVRFAFFNGVVRKDPFLLCLPKSRVETVIYTQIPDHEGKPFSWKNSRYEAQMNRI